VEEILNSSTASHIVVITALLSTRSLNDLAERGGYIIRKPVLKEELAATMGEIVGRV
jgi:hypothetical protein